MTARGRTSNLNNEWDMNDDFNNTTCDSQYPDENASGGAQYDHCRLYIRNIPKALNDEGLRTAFSKFGTLTEVFLSKDQLKKYALVRYETPGEAKLAMTKLNNTEPLGLNIRIAHKPKSEQRRDDREPRHSIDRVNSSSYTRNNREEDTASVGSRGINSRKLEVISNGEDLEDLMPPLDEDMDPDTKMRDIQLELQRLQVQERTMLLKKQLLHLEASRKKQLTQSNTSPSNRCVLPNGRVVVRNIRDRYNHREKVVHWSLESRDEDDSFAAGAGDSNERKNVCSCKEKYKTPWDQPGSSEGSSTPSTCVLCLDDCTRKLDRPIQAKSVASKYTDFSKQSDYSSRCDKTTELSRKSVASKTTDLKTEYSKTDTANQKSDVTSKKLDIANKGKGRSDLTCDCNDFYDDDSDEEVDETNRLIQLRNSDYMDIVGDTLKVVIALAGYPKSKMRLRQMESFQRCLAEVIDMQLKNGLLKKVPSFLDYYLNRGAIVCVCKDLDTRNWVVRVSPGLQERMCTNLILLKSKVKRLCLAVMKIPRSCWPATAQDAFKLLQYFNPTLKTKQWKIYAQKCTDNVETTSFLIDRLSGEIIRGPTFKNVLDYSQMEFELTGYTEIYYQCLMSDLEEDICSVASRVKLLEEIRSEETTPRIAREEVDFEKQNVTYAEEDGNSGKVELSEVVKDSDDENVCDTERNTDVKKEFENTLQKEILKKLKDVKYISGEGEVIIWSDETNIYNSDPETDVKNEEEGEGGALTEIITGSDKTESIIESNDNLIGRGSNLNIDSNRGIAYHRRTNYLHVENELKVAITLDGYPQNKLEGTHIRRLKHLFKEYLHKDMKMQRFANLIIPKFQDVYLSNGAVIYICDSLETKDYLTEVLPKFINSTGLKLHFTDIKSLVRYTRVVLRLSKEHAHVESIEILLKLREVYPGLKPDCWKYYSDVAGKQKRQFGVDPDSLEVIRSPDFDPIYEGEKLIFRIIDRQKRDVSFDGTNTKDVVIESNDGNKVVKDKVLKLMYAPIDPEITKIPLTRLRTCHYSDVIADDLKLYVGPASYPETRIDENLFHSIKKAFEAIICDSFEKEELNEDCVPKFHDMYLFDGVIFIICCDLYSREWMERNIKNVNSKLDMNLKPTEFRGAVGIISMMVKTTKDTEAVIADMQKLNPRLRTKYWRIISTVRTRTKLDVILQIDKLSAQVITSPDFNKTIDGSAVKFKLGHLQSLLKPKLSLEALTKSHTKRMAKSDDDKVLESAKRKTPRTQKTIEELKSDINEKYPDLKIEQWDVISNKENSIKIFTYEDSKVIEDGEKNLLAGETETASEVGPQMERISPEESYTGDKKVLLKIPPKLIPDNKEDLNILFDLLEDKNPGLNTELWRVFTASTYPNNGKVYLFIDKQSAYIIQGKNFDPMVGGEKLKFIF
ncbi:unnamed protein product [Chilo suppressalis]|uniref:RRM domain-containing protein n=1 Tax=Chilo suppressalis TaxID=168631 RepID=A0ABN8B4E9_CHISP|nr:unnamed protein product [Chilo suppressalis]